MYEMMKKFPNTFTRFRQCCEPDSLADFIFHHSSAIAFPRNGEERGIINSDINDWHWIFSTQNFILPWLCKK